MKLLGEDTIFTVNDQFNAIDAQLKDDFRRRQKWEYEQVKAITAKYLEIDGEVYIGTDAPAGTWVYPGLSMIEELHEFKSFNLDAFDILKKIHHDSSNLQKYIIKGPILSDESSFASFIRRAGTCPAYDIPALPL